MTEKPNPAPARLLLVEDNPVDARLILGMLRNDPYTIVEATTLAEGIEQATATCPDLVLLDLTLPDSAGMETVRAMREHVGDAAIVILSGLSDQELAESAVSMGVQDYLVKGEITQTALRRALRYSSERARLTSERVDLERSLSQSRKLEAVGQLAAGVAHEINTPTQYVSDNASFIRDALTELVAVLERLQDVASGEEPLAGKELQAILDEADVDYLIEEIPQALQQSIDGLGNISRIVRAMKEFSHPASSEKEPTNLNAALNTTTVVASSEWKYVADIETDLDPDLPAVICLRGEINQVFLNLIVNAAHAIGDVVEGTRSKGRIAIATRDAGDGWIEIEISDTGCGIPQSHIDKVFDPFFTTKEVGKGTGQGLAIAYDVVVNKHGGTIDIDSVQGEGTRFLIRLPQRPEDEAEGAEATAGATA